MQYFNNLIMRKTIFLAAIATLFACNASEKSDYLVKYGGSELEGTAPGYKNSKGEIVVEEAKYGYCFTDTITKMGIVRTHEASYLGIDVKGNILFEIYPFDNGPDYEQEGLFRIQKDGKIGYANMDGEIIIQPQFACAFPFEDGKAKVALACEEVFDEDEYTTVHSDEWFYINTKGDKVE